MRARMRLHFGAAVIREQRWYRGTDFVLCEQNKLARDVFLSLETAVIDLVKYFEKLYTK